MIRSTTLALALLLSATAAQAGTPAAAIADPTRPAADKARDADRKPLDMLQFARIKEGMTVVDIMPGGGYFTRLFSDVVGPKGKVYAYVPEEISTRAPRIMEGLKTLAAEPAHANVTPITHPLMAVPPASIHNTMDVIWTSQNYHDFHGMPGVDMVAFNKLIFDRIKPGGYYVVEDHRAAPGSGADGLKLHRIDPAIVRQEVEAAGFKFDGESNVLRNPADTHTLPVFDASLRGHTDQFVYRFRKPK